MSLAGKIQEFIISTSLMLKEIDDDHKRMERASIDAFKELKFENKDTDKKLDTIIKMLAKIDTRTQLMERDTKTIKDWVFEILKWSIAAGAVGGVVKYGPEIVPGIIQLIL